MSRARFLITALAISLLCNSAFGLTCLPVALKDLVDRSESITIARLQSITPTANSGVFELTFFSMESVKGTTPKLFGLSSREWDWNKPLEKYDIGSDYLIFLKPEQVSLGVCDGTERLDEGSTERLKLVRSLVALTNTT